MRNPNKKARPVSGPGKRSWRKLSAAASGIVGTIVRVVLGAAVLVHVVANGIAGSTPGHCADHGARGGIAVGPSNEVTGGASDDGTGGGPRLGGGTSGAAGQHGSKGKGEELDGDGFHVGGFCGSKAPGLKGCTCQSTGSVGHIVLRGIPASGFSARPLQGHPGTSP